MRKIPEFIEEAVRFRVPVSITETGFIVDGFYKSGAIEIFKNNDAGWIALSRYNTEDKIESLEDLARLNKSWWIRSRDRSADWEQPDQRWLPVLKQYGLVKETAVPQSFRYEP